MVPRCAASRRPDAIPVGAGEASAGVPEELGLEQGVGDGGAVDCDERLRRARGVRVDVLRDDVLADAAFAGDEDFGVAGCGARRQAYGLAASHGSRRPAEPRPSRARAMSDRAPGERSSATRQLHANRSESATPQQGGRPKTIPRVGPRFRAGLHTFGLPTKGADVVLTRADMFRGGGGVVGVRFGFVVRGSRFRVRGSGFKAGFRSVHERSNAEP